MHLATHQMSCPSISREENCPEAVNCVKVEPVVGAGSWMSAVGFRLLDEAHHHDRRLIIRKKTHLQQVPPLTKARSQVFPQQSWVEFAVRKQRTE